MQIHVKIVAAFVEDNKGGNPAGVVLDADHLTRDQKINIAARVGLSETAFVSRSDQSDFKLDFLRRAGRLRIADMPPLPHLPICSKLGRIPKPETSKGR